MTRRSVLTKEQEEKLSFVERTVYPKSTVAEVCALTRELAEHKRILFEENGKLLTEKEAGLWDANHPVRTQLAICKDALEKIENYYPHSSSCALSPFVVNRGTSRGSVCTCGTANNPIVKFARSTLDIIGVQE